MEKQTAIIEIDRLTHRFGDGTLGFDRIDLHIPAGQMVILCGPNGSGKTTLLRHLNGLLKPESGRVTVSGIDVSKQPSKARQQVGMVFQDADSQIIGETVFDDTAFGPENLMLNRDEINDRVNQVLSLVDLTHLSDQRPHLLSAGEKRRLAIAGVLVMKPRVILFDEPFSNLDYPGAIQVRKQILALHQSGHTLVIATHDLHHIIDHADRIVVMKNGRIVGDGDPVLMVADLEMYGVEKPCDCRLNQRAAI